MKKILALILLIAMTFSLVACDLDKIASNFKDAFGDIMEDSDKDSDSSESETTSQESTSEETSEEESSTEEIPVGPNYEDQTKYYYPEENEQGKYIYRESITFSKPVFTQFYHNYKAAVSMTFDDGYHEETGYYVSKAFNKYGFKGTAMFSVCFVEDEYTQNEWKKILSYGYIDVGGHGWGHADPTAIADEEELLKETVETVDFLRKTFTSQNVLTFATPFARLNEEYKEKLKECVISNRLESGGNTMELIGTDLYEVKAISFNRGRPFSSVQPTIKQMIDSGKWVTVLMHCVGGVNSTDVSEQEFESLCQYLSFQNDVWVGSFEEVSIYAKQLQNAKLEYTAADKETITFKLTSTLDKSIYNIPMSAKIYIPSFATTAYAVVDGKVQHSFVKSDMYGKYITVLDIPIDSEAVIYLGGNSWCENDCESHNYTLVETVDATCTECAYQLHECENCGNQYRTRFLAPKGHSLDYSKVQEIKAPTEYTTGTSKAPCSTCQKDIEYLVRYTGDSE